MIFSERLDRQLRIEGWNQAALDTARIGIVGDSDLLTSFFLLSAAALGLNDAVVIAPGLDPRLIDLAHQINSDFDMKWVEGFYTHPVLDDVFEGCNAMVDLSRYGLANKLVLDKAFREKLPVVRGWCCEHADKEGFKVFTYKKGREWQELQEVISSPNLPARHFNDPVLSIIASGMVLEETKNLLMQRRASEELIEYSRRRLATPGLDSNICVVGAGALGNFVGLGLAYSGFRNITFIDPDIVELTNLNRQVLLGGGLGMNKADVLAARLSSLFDINARASVGYFGKDTDIAAYDVIFDCVDNFETRIVVSEKCKAARKLLIGGGTSVDAGQVVAYNPMEDEATPAEFLGLYDIADSRKSETHKRERASCTYQPDPSVITTNQIIAGFMIDAYRMLLNGYRQRGIFYDATSDKRI